MCLGERLARMELLMFFVTFVQRYDISLPDGVPLPSVTPNESFVNSPKPYQVVFTRRDNQ